MKTYLDCVPCFMDQALRAGRIATNNEGLSNVDRPTMLIVMTSTAGLRLRDRSCQDYQ